VTNKILTEKIWIWRDGRPLEVKRDGNDILLWERPPGAFSVAIKYMQTLNMSTTWTGEFRIDVTRISEQILKKSCLDWIWNECFNSWNLLAWFKNDRACVFVISFDVESDANKFWNWIK